MSRRYFRIFAFSAPTKQNWYFVAWFAAVRGWVGMFAAFGAAVFLDPRRTQQNKNFVAFGADLWYNKDNSEPEANSRII